MSLISSSLHFFTLSWLKFNKNEEMDIPNTSQT